MRALLRLNLARSRVGHDGLEQTCSCKAHEEVCCTEQANSTLSAWKQAPYWIAMHDVTARGLDELVAFAHLHTSCDTSWA